MKAIVYTRYGLLEGLQFKEVAKPTPKKIEAIGHKVTSFKLGD